MKMSGESGGRRICLSELNDHITCKVCGGYFRDATTVKDCFHTCEYLLENLFILSLNSDLFDYSLQSLHSDVLGSQQAMSHLQSTDT